MELLNKKELEQLPTLINKLSTGKVLVIGDIILDEFVLGSPERISREAPVIILEHICSDFALGGASNAAHNISALGAKCYLISVTGDDIYSKALQNECTRLGITPLVVVDKNRPTTVKTRILSIAHKHPTSSIRFKQQLLRLDKLSKKEITSKVVNELVECFDKYVKQVEVVLISDYGLGTCTRTLVKHVVDVSIKNNKPVIVDAPCNFERFQGAYLITPNQPDTEEAVGFTISDTKSLIKAGEKLLGICKAENVLITRGSEGMALFNNNSSKKPCIIPAFNASEVFDVTGAGDTVAGVVACAVGIKTPLKTACIIANLAASIVVKKYGTAVTSTSELLKQLKTL